MSDQRPKGAVGFTGTRNGMTKAQTEVFRVLLSSLKATEFHHGDCVGADDEAANVAYLLGVAVIKHPPLDDKFQAHNMFWHATFIAKSYLARNRDIVDNTDVLIGTPKESAHQLVGGTWYTIDYVKSKEKTVFIIWPNGQVTKYEEGWETDFIV